jgi:hypothetical protein
MMHFSKTHTNSSAAKIRPWVCKHKNFDNTLVEFSTWRAGCFKNYFLQDCDCENRVSIGYNIFVFKNPFKPPAMTISLKTIKIEANVENVEKIFTTIELFPCLGFHNCL